MTEHKHEQKKSLKNFIFSFLFQSDTFSWLLSLHFFLIHFCFASTSFQSFLIFFFVFLLFLYILSCLCFNNSVHLFNRLSFTLTLNTYPHYKTYTHLCAGSDLNVVHNYRSIAFLTLYSFYLAATAAAETETHQQQRSRFYCCSRQGSEIHSHRDSERMRGIQRSK